jgi:O-antigen ligase/polysaccharide polymerase Wzy-like membrane protein
MLFALPGLGAGATTGRILDILVFVLAASLAYRLPRSVPYVAVFAVGLQSTLSHTLTSDGDALAGLAIGLSAMRVRSGTFTWRLRLTHSFVALAILNLLVVLSLLANYRGPNGHSVTLDSEYFISRSILAAAVILLSDREADWQQRWGQALGLLALVLSLYRLSEAVGLPLKPAADALGIAVLGDYVDPANANLFAVLAGVGIAFLLADAGQRDRRLGVHDSARWLAAAVATLGMASAESRTALATFVVVIVALLALAATWKRRVFVVGLASVYLLGSLLPAFAISQKPIVVSTTLVGDSAVITNKKPLVAPPEALAGGTVPAPVSHAPLPALRPQWRSPLDRTNYRLEAILPPAAAGRGHYLDFIGRTGGGALGVFLNVSVNGALVAQLRPSDMSTDYRWEEVPIPDALVGTAKPLSVDFVASGDLNSARNYFLLGGVYARAEGFTSRFWTGSSWVTSDLSSDPGTQTGLFTVFLDGYVPPFTYFAVPSNGVLDPSVADRFVLWHTAVNVFLHNPLLGTGFYTFGLVKVQYEPQDSPLIFSYANAHSNYFELLSDLGFAGPLLFLLVLLVPVVEVTRRTVSSRRSIGWLPPAMALALVVYLLSSATQSWVADSRVYVTAWFVALVSASPTAAKSLAQFARSWVTNRSADEPGTRSSSSGLKPEIRPGARATGSRSKSPTATDHDADGRPTPSGERGVGRRSKNI